MKSAAAGMRNGRRDPVGRSMNAAANRCNAIIGHFGGKITNTNRNSSASAIPNDGRHSRPFKAARRKKNDKNVALKGDQ